MADYREHVAKYPNTDLPILAYLTRHINGLMCSEIEQVVTRLVKERLALGCGDEATSNYLTSLRRNAIRNAKFSEVKRTLALFGTLYRDYFDKLVQESLGEAGVERLGIAVGKRDQDAHETPPDITFDELEKAFVVASKMVDAVRVTLED